MDIEQLIAWARNGAPEPLNYAFSSKVVDRAAVRRFIAAERAKHDAPIAAGEAELPAARAAIAAAKQELEGLIRGLAGWHNLQPGDLSSFRLGTIAAEQSDPKFHDCAARLVAAESAEREILGGMATARHAYNCAAGVLELKLAEYPDAAKDRAA